ncbi:MAG: hypothetical protein K2J77_05880 [Oscillospiraceae bacterium]|nr:hypothetical protein [Oscillospiraceae bacterium]
MNAKKYRVFYFLSLLGVVAASFYPILMGVRVISETLKNGAVPLENYPKYVIPYTPIAIAVILGVALIPLFQKMTKKLDLLFGAFFSLAVFFVAERLMETKVLVQTTELVPLEGWQMALCYVPPEAYQTRVWEAVDILLGGYSPAFKLHFYLISAVIILSLLNCFYGFAKMIRNDNYSRKTALIIQSVTSLAFLGMCIWACFTSFYRTGELTVSPISAALMAAFFALFGVCVGVFVGSLTLGRNRALSMAVPSVVSILATLAMYIGEMILLNGNLYRFGNGFFFEGLGAIVLAPVDLVIILAAGAITLMICDLVNRKKAK